MTAPTSRFENGGLEDPSWSSITEENEFLSALESASERVSIKVLGSSVNATPIKAICIGYPVAPSEAFLKAAEIVVFVAAQHGNELSGREGSLQFARDIAFSEDPAVQDYLRQHPVMIIPSVNPDGFPNSRNNANNVNINREWISYTQPENQAVGTALRDYKPHLVIDLHEMPERDAQFKFRFAEHGECSEGIVTASRSLMNAAKDDLAADGYDAAMYPRGDFVTYLLNSSSLRNSISILVEATGQSVNSVLTRKNATRGMVRVMGTVLNWHTANADTVREVVATGLFDAHSAGAAQTALIVPNIPNPPLGYVLTAAQRTQLTPSLDRLNIRSYQIQSSTEHYVPMAQGSRRLIPQLMDTDSGDKEVSAQRVNTAPAVTGTVPLTNLYLREAGTNGLSLAAMGLETEAIRVETLKQNAPYEFRAQVQEVGDSSALSSWEPFSTTGAANFDVEWRLLGDVGNESLIIDIPETSYLLEALTSGLDYDARVKEYENGASSAWSAWTGFTTAAAATSVTMTISESTTATDTESAQANLLSTISESTTATDTTTGKLSASLSLNESAGASDTDQGQYATSQEIIEAVQASDLTGTLLKAILTQNLSALASDTVSLKANYGLTVSETASGTDSTAGKAALIATLSESASGTDAVSIPPEGVVNLTIGEVSTATDNVSMTASFTMTIGEAAQAADSVSGRAALLASISEAISATDSFDGFAPTAYTVTIGETATATDAVSIVLASLKGFITATITINPIIIGDANIEPIVAGNVDAETMINAQGNIVPMITGTITVS